MQAQDARTPWMAAGEELPLLLRARKGDRDAFLALVRHYHRPLYRLAFALTRDVHVAVSLTRDVALAASQEVRQVPDGQRFFPWLARSLRDRVRARDRSEAPTGRPLTAPVIDPEVDEVARRYLAALDALDPDHLAALALRVAERLPYAQIESVLRTPAGSALAIVAVARARIAASTETGERAA